MMHKWIISFILPVLLWSSSCKKLVEVDPPDDWLVSGIVFSSDSMARAAVTGVYTNIMGQTKSILNGGMSLFPGLSADELDRTSILSNEQQFASNSLSSANALVGNNIWKAAYTYLYQCNIILEGLEKSESVSQSEKRRLSGEVRFVRALCYTYLVNLFGDVPLVINSDADKNAVLPRSPVDSVYSLIVSDLQLAYAILPDAMENTRPNKMACQALLARVYLYRKEWGLAASAASSIINSGQYQMTIDLNQVFKSQSAETIFQWAPVLEGINSAEGNFFNPASPTAKPLYSIKPELRESFEADDLRKNNWTKKIQPTTSGPEYTFPYKYKIISSSEPAIEYNVVLRLAEQYLIRAEARVQQNNIIEALSDINIIRTRAGLNILADSLDEEQCMTAIRQERRVEFFAEWGHRWIDLKRWQKAHVVLSVVKGSDWQQYDQLYPIPFLEIERDPNLIQNEGY